MDIGQVIEQYHSGLHVFAVGNPEPIKAMYARSEDVLLANPFGGSSRGWDAVSQALDFASSNFRDGAPVRFEEVSCSSMSIGRPRSAVATSPRPSTCASRPHFGWRATDGNWSVATPTR